MKWTLWILTAVGILAALAAAVLVAALRADGLRKLAHRPEALQSQAPVLITQRSLPAMTIVEASMVSVSHQPRDQVTPETLAEPTQVIGKLLAHPVLSGEVLTSRSLVSEASATYLAVKLAAQLPLGKRAVAITVSDAGGLHGILYPGCRVDVLMAIKRTNSGDEAPQTFSTTLLEKITVLAVNQQMVTSPDRKTPEDASSFAARIRDLKVTLLVETQQAKALQLAQDVGTLSLALRNPLDEEKGRISLPVSLRLLAGGHGGEPEVKAVLPSFKPAPTPPWQTTILRGSVSEVRAFPAWGQMP